MKQVMIILCAMIAFSSVGQTVQTKAVVQEVKMLQVTYNKTTNLVFPAAITSVDRGSEDVLVQKAVGAENVLRVKADVKNFAETNLSVITADGRLYSFVVNYAENPSELNVTIESAKGVAVNNDEGSIVPTNFVNIIKVKRGNVRSIEDKSSKVSAKLNGFFVNGNTIFCKLKLANGSRIDYDIDQFHFYIRDKRKGKRTASQEVEVAPISVVGDTGTLQAKTFRVVIVALPKFTIPDGKLLTIELMEHNGGRHLYLRAKNRHLMKARRV